MEKETDYSKLSQDELGARRKALIQLNEKNSIEIDKMSKVMHVRNMKEMGKKKLAEFMIANGVTTEDLKG